MFKSSLLDYFNLLSEWVGIVVYWVIAYLLVCRARHAEMQDGC